MTPTEKFLQAPMSFLEKNILIASPEVTRGSAPLSSATTAQTKAPGDGLCYVGLSKLERLAGFGKTVRGIRNGAPCAVYELVGQQAGDKNAFCAYWLPARSTKPCATVISDKAGMMFATSSSRHPLQVGHKSGNGDRLIAQFNAYRGAQATGPVAFATVFGRISVVSKDWIFYGLKYDCSVGPGGIILTHKGLGSLMEAAA